MKVICIMIIHVGANCFSINLFTHTLNTFFCKSEKIHVIYNLMTFKTISVFDICVFNSIFNHNNKNHSF